MKNAPPMPRFAVNAWKEQDGRIGPELTFMTYPEARDAARELWVQHKGKLRVTIFDDYTRTIMWRLDPGELEPARDPLPCHDPQHVNPAHAPYTGKERRKTRRR